MKQQIIARLKEPSTYAGAATLAQVVTVFNPAWGNILTALMGLFGAVAMVLPETKGTT